jgi:hypothetical protein
MAQTFSSVQHPIVQTIQEIVQKNICTTKDKQWIKSILEDPSNRPISIVNRKLFDPTSYDESGKEDSRQQLFALIKLCSKFHVNSPLINELLEYLCCMVEIKNLYDLAHRRFYRSPELVPQQFYHYLKEKTEEMGIVLGDYHSCLTEVHYLADSVIGFYIHNNNNLSLPPIEWKSSKKIEWRSIE